MVGGHLLKNQVFPLRSSGVFQFDLNGGEQESCAEIGGMFGQKPGQDGHEPVQPSKSPAERDQGIKRLLAPGIRKEDFFVPVPCLLRLVGRPMNGGQS